jgi:redox-sensitive bicupin YhaK (pirin superfamily)
MSIIEGRARDLGGFTVRRVLPSPQRRLIGPFIFFDEMGPAQFAPGTGIDVRPHPHIGLSTLTYLFDGAIDHRDSLGVVQTIRPGDVNWMTAGSGVVHSERTPPAERAAGHRLWGIQAWLALPKAEEQRAASFQHVPGADLPCWREGVVDVTLIAGQWGMAASPVAVYSPLFYLDLCFTAAGRFSLPATSDERGVYVVEGTLRAGGATYVPGQMVFCDAGEAVDLDLDSSGRLMLLGGEAFPEPRVIDWNFVATDPALIAAAKTRWQEDAFAKVPGETERIPLPG